MGSSHLQRIKTQHLYALSVLLSVAIMATLYYGYSKVVGDTLSTAPSNVQAQTEAASPAPEPVSMQNARQIAQAQKPGAVVTKVEPTPQGGVITSYDVHFSDGSKVKVNVENGQVTQGEEPAIKQGTTSPAAPEPTTEPETSPEPTPDNPENPSETPSTQTHDNSTEATL